MRKKAWLTALLLMAALCWSPAGVAGAPMDDLSDLFRTWVWQGTRGTGDAGTPRALFFSFGEDGLVEIEERAGGTVEGIKASFRIEGPVMHIQALDENLNPLEEMTAELPFVLENGTLRLTLDGEETVFRPLTPVR